MIFAIVLIGIMMVLWSGCIMAFLEGYIQHQHKKPFISESPRKTFYGGTV